MLGTERVTRCVRELDMHPCIGLEQGGEARHLALATKMARTTCRDSMNHLTRLCDGAVGRLAAVGATVGTTDRYAPVAAARRLATGGPTSDKRRTQPEQT